MPQQPVALVLLDISMPILNGLDTLKQIKTKYGKFDETRLIRPLICYLSQLSYSPMNNFIAEDEQPDCYLEKPLPFNEL